jgi:hypothetical protein
VERLGGHARGEERVEREPERGVPHASAPAGAPVGGRPGEEVRGGGRQERCEEDRGEGAERGRGRREAGGGGEAGSERGGGGRGCRGAWLADGVKREVALRGGLEEAGECEEGAVAERRRQREDAAVVGKEELRGWIVGVGGGGSR